MACLELLEFCLNDPSTETSLKTDLELKKKELDLYHQVVQNLVTFFLLLGKKNLYSNKVVAETQFRRVLVDFLIEGLCNFENQLVVV